LAEVAATWPSVVDRLGQLAQDLAGALEDIAGRLDLSITATSLLVGWPAQVDRDGR
jgi:hypothetical protein